jgi:hypothetical protein
MSRHAIEVARMTRPRLTGPLRPHEWAVIGFGVGLVIWMAMSMWGMG